jgi:hypothetical protein
MKVIRQIIRGCGTLPHVGSHPGTAILVMFVVFGPLCVTSAGPAAMAMDAGLMILMFGPIYLWGAYDRAWISDKISDSGTRV